LEEIRINTWQTKKGFEVLFKQYYEPLCAFVYGILKDYNASEEVVQDLFVKMWIKRKSILTDTSIKAYLYRAARNLALNQLKHHIIKEQYKQYNKKELDNAGHNSGNLTEENELNGMVIRAIDKLPAKRKKIFLMSRKTVENQMGKALSTLRTELAEYLPAVIIAIILGMKSG
jgi:RNA polymerase sigma-70 factor (ECF subfamily)